MFKNYFIVAWRNLLKSKWYSLINTLGLSIGMAVAFLIGLWIWDEITYNRYFDNHARLAQVMTTQTFNDKTGTGNAVSLPINKVFRTDYAGDFKAVSQASWNFRHILAVGDKKISQSGMWVQPEFPDMFTLKMISGKRDGLQDPSSIFLSQSLARSLFGSSDPMGKTVKVDNKIEMKVTGIYEDFPHNTTLNETLLLMPWEKYVAGENWVKKAQDQWGNHSWQLFVQMQPNADFARTTQKIRYLPRPHNKDGNEELVLQPMDNWRLYNHFTNGKVDGGRIQFVWLFGIIGVFVLILACINFMNLSTARSEKRAKEVGIRKTVGSLRGQLIGQFLSESIVVAFLAFILAIGWVLLFLPFFNSVSDKEMHLPWAQPVFWMLALGFTIVTGLLAGSYPAFYLSSFDPIRVLKGSFRAGRFASLPRKILVVIQFTVSVALIIGTILVFRQIQYTQSRPVGYTREGLITISMTTPEINGHYVAMRNDLLATGAVEDMAESSSPATDIYSNLIGFEWKGKDPNSVPLFSFIACTHDFGRTVGWKIKEGHDFSRELLTDSSNFILNEAAVKLVGIPHPAGQIIKWDGKDHKVAGVIYDMVMGSPYQPVPPTIYWCDYGWTGNITVRLKSTMTTHAALAAIEPVFKKYDPGNAFQYRFVDEEYARKFSDEQRIGRLASTFAILAVFISCLGLFGLASFVAEQRTREIGVRKVLGASLFNLWRMLSKDFLLLVIISCAIAIPIAWYFLYQWLQRYEYRTPISWWVFVVASVGALVITLLTVSYQAIRAARMNPVHSLRTE